MRITILLLALGTALVAVGPVAAQDDFDTVRLSDDEQTDEAMPNPDANDNDANDNDANDSDAADLDAPADDEAPADNNRPPADVPEEIGGAGQPASPLGNIENRWRYRFDNGRWWYWSAQRQWWYWNDGTWQRLADDRGNRPADSGSAGSRAGTPGAGGVGGGSGGGGGRGSALGQQRAGGQRSGQNLGGPGLGGQALGAGGTQDFNTWFNAYRGFSTGRAALRTAEQGGAELGTADIGAEAEANAAETFTYGGIPRRQAERRRAGIGRTMRGSGSWFSSGSPFGIRYGYGSGFGFGGYGFDNPYGYGSRTGSGGAYGYGFGPFGSVGGQTGERLSSLISGGAEPQLIGPEPPGIGAPQRLESAVGGSVSRAGAGARRLGGGASGGAGSGSGGAGD